MKRNLISPAFMAFFNLGDKQMYSLSDGNVAKVNTEPTYDNSLPFLPDYVNSINFGNIFHYAGKKVGRCSDNKKRICKVFIFEFEYEGCTFSFPFLLDKSLDKPAILGRESFNQIIKSVIKNLAHCMCCYIL